MRFAKLIMVCALLAAAPGCIFADFNMKLFSDYTAPLQEYTLDGEGELKVAIIPVVGTIDSETESTWVGTRPSMVQEVVAHLGKAAADPDVKAVVLQIDSPGGTVTASDIIYREIEKFKSRSNARIVAAMMDVAASGGYYVASASDRIVAHPTTVTGSIGVIFIRPNIAGLMDKIGATAEINKSGTHKDMGSPFREPNEEEDKLFQEIIDEYYDRFVDIVAKHRGLDRETVIKVADGRVYTGLQARKAGLVDSVGYLSDAVLEAKNIAGLPRDARVVVYRRSPVSDDNAYNSATAQSGPATPKLIDLGLDPFTTIPRTGFYYIWLPGN